MTSSFEAGAVGRWAHNVLQTEFHRFITIYSQMPVASNLTEFGHQSMVLRRGNTRTYTVPEF